MSLDDSHDGKDTPNAHKNNYLHNKGYEFYHMQSRYEAKTNYNSLELLGKEDYYKFE